MNERQNLQMRLSPSLSLSLSLSERAWTLGFMRSRVAIFKLYVSSVRQPAFCVSV